MQHKVIFTYGHLDGAGEGSQGQNRLILLVVIQASWRSLQYQKVDIF